MMRTTSWNNEKPLEANDLRVAPSRSMKQLDRDSVLAVKRAFFKLGVGEPDDGVRTHCLQKALRLLKGLVLDAIVDDKKNAEKFNFGSVPLECFGKTMDDTLVAFLAWSKLQGDNECYDVSKAFERLGEYATWMHSRREELKGLSNDSVQRARRSWNIMTSTEKGGRVVWWLDLASVEGLKELTAQESLQFFVWFAHSLIFRTDVQQRGVVIALNLARVDLTTFLAMLPPNLTRRLEQFTINILPIETRQMYVTGSPRWSKIFTTVVKPFMTDDLRSRMIAFESTADLSSELGIDCIPEGFGRTVKDVAMDNAKTEELFVPREIFQVHGIEAPIILPKEPTPLLREWNI